MFKSDLSVYFMQWTGAGVLGHHGPHAQRPVAAVGLTETVPVNTEQ